VHARRKRGGQPVIDSGVLRVPHWSAREHGDFFLRVIAELCCDVILLDGWEYSSGATKEFIFAQQHGVPCFDASNIELTLERGRLLIEQAMEVVRESGGPFDVFERRLQSISGLSSG
jgi:hypothetical protein